ncbi:MAG: AEC family transporter [Eubacteriales bacterium]|nr:AEC family transporter [Eubacteriales bacterium]
MTVSISSVVNVILPLFLILLLGTFIRKIGVIDWQTTKKLSSFVVNITHPFLIIASFQTEVTSDKLLIALEIIAASIVLHVSFSILARFLFKNSEKADRATLEFGLIFGNCGFLGFPVLMAVFPTNGLFYGAAFTLVFNIYIRIYGVYLLNKGKKDSNALRKAFVNPGTIASFIGIIMFVCSIKLPAALFNTFTTVGDLTFPLSMLVVGSLLCNQPFRNLFRRKIYIFSFARLLLLPVLVLTICSVLFVDKGLTYVCVIMASMPTAANTALFSELYKSNSPLAASCVGITSLLSVVTIPAMLALTDLMMNLLGR